MLAKDIQKHELSFHTTGKALEREYGLNEHEIDIPGLQKKMNYFVCTPADGNQGYFYDQEYSKKKIVLHFTAGYLKGDIEALTKPDYHVSVAFLIGRSGKIYNLFQSAKWSYHLGSCDSGDNTVDSRSSVAIEISNIGPLTLSGNTLLNYRGEKYCGLSETSYYIKLTEPFRGYEYFASFTDEQYASLISLLQYLTAKYQIPARFLPEDLRYETCEAASDFEGIVSHVNFRENDKWDLGPAFNWKLIEQSLQ